MLPDSFWVELSHADPTQLLGMFLFGLSVGAAVTFARMISSDEA